jgi:hypothetical protein
LEWFCKQGLRRKCANSLGQVNTPVPFDPGSGTWRQARPGHPIKELQHRMLFARHQAV